MNEQNAQLLLAKTEPHAKAGAGNAAPADAPAASPGFKLPNPDAPPAAPPPAQPAPPVQPAQIIVPDNPPPAVVKTDAGSRDLAIGGGALLALLIVFFFAKGWYANLLVGRRVAPRAANASGWWLFIFLGSLASGVVLSVVDPNRFLVWIYMIPLGALALAALILTLLTGRR
jgi:hypothetical protein